MEVVVLHNVEYGWDCVEGVFINVDKAVEYLNTKLLAEGNKEDLEDIGWVFTKKTIVE